MEEGLEYLFCPRGIAVIGASANPGSVGEYATRVLLAHKYPGAVYPVNPRYDEILGLPCYPDVREIPGEVDVAIVAVNAAQVAETIRRCGEKGVRAAVIFSAGFAELGPAGRELQRELAAVACGFGIRLVGPNCQGLMNVHDRVWLGFGTSFELELRQGPVSMVTQSGGFGYAMVGVAEEEGAGFRYVVSSGNEADLTALDYMEFFLHDPQTKVIVGYIEGIKDGRRLRRVADLALELEKPMLIWKVGDTEIGQRAAASHTANLGGAPTLYRSVFREKGILPINDADEMADLARAFQGGKLPKGRGVGVVTISGGAGVLVADYLITRGLELPPISDSCRAKLRDLVPSYASLQNPVDVTAQIFNNPDLLGKALRQLVAEEQLHSLLVISASIGGPLAHRMAREIAEVAAGTDKPILVSWSARAAMARDAFSLLTEAAVPFFRTPTRAARAVAALASYATARERFRRERQEPATEPWKPAPELFSLLRSYPPQLAEYQAKQFLSRCGIPVTREYLAAGVESALAAAHGIRYPVVLKVQSPDLPHKTEAGAVRIGVRSDRELRKAFADVLEGARRYRPEAEIHGVLVQEVVAGAVEVILGVSNDPIFGPSVMFGLGGIFTEVLRDVSFRLTPIRRSAAEEMLQEIRGYPVLRGARGRPPCDVAALSSVLERLSWVAEEMKDEIAELDINPLFVLPEGQGVKVGDALIRRKDTRGRPLDNM